MQLLDSAYMARYGDSTPGNVSSPDRSISVVTVYDVAREAGVSTATVSRVVRGSNRVQPQTRDRVLAVIEALGYVPNASARGLSTSRTDIIGLVAVERGDTAIDIEQTGLLFTDQVIRAVEEALRGRDYSLLLSFAGTGEAISRRVRLLSGRVDGLLIAEGILPSEELRTLAHRVPVVVMAGRHDETEVDIMGVDNRAGVTALTTHFIEVHGATRLAVLAGPDDSPDAQERLAAFRDTVAQHPGVTVHSTLHGTFAESSGWAATSLLVGSGAGLPDAVVCANDQMAIGLIRGLEQAGVKVPQDVGVGGFDDIHASAMVHPPLTTVRQPIRDMAYRATNRLLDRISNPALAPRIEVLPTDLVVRASCGCPRTIA